MFLKQKCIIAYFYSGNFITFIMAAGKNAYPFTRRRGGSEEGLAIGGNVQINPQKP